MNKPRNDLWKVQKHFSDGKVTVTPARRQSTTGTNNFTEDAPASRTQLLTISPALDVIMQQPMEVSEQPTPH